jgi:hypothetical protein
MKTRNQQFELNLKLLEYKVFVDRLDTPSGLKPGLRLSDDPLDTETGLPVFSKPIEGIARVTLFVSFSANFAKDSAIVETLGMEGSYFISCEQPDSLQNQLLVQYDREHIHFYRYDVVNEDDVEADGTEKEVVLQAKSGAVPLAANEFEAALFAVLETWVPQRLQELMQTGCYSVLDSSRASVINVDL